MYTSGSSYNALNENTYFDKSYWTKGEEYDPDFDLFRYQTLEELRKLSSLLIKNSFIAQALQLTIVNLALGGTPNIHVHYENKEKEWEINSVLQECFKGMNVDEDLTLLSFCEMLIATAFCSGDELISLVFDEERELPTKLFMEIIDGSRVKTPKDLPEDPNLRHGILYNDMGRITHAYVRKLANTSQGQFQAGLSQEYNRMPFYYKNDNLNKRLLYFYRAPSNLKANQTRGLPSLTPLFNLIRYFNQYLESVLIGANTAAKITAVMTTDNPEKAKNDLTVTEADGTDRVRIDPGFVWITKRSGKIDFAAPNRPSDNQDPFIRRLINFMAMCLRISLPQYTLDLSDVNYSSFTGGDNENRKTSNRWRDGLTPVLTWYTTEVLKDLKLRKVLDFSLSKCQISIIYSNTLKLDPEKEARSEKISKDNGVLSVQEICRQKGYDYDILQKEKLEYQIDEVQARAKVLKEIKKVEKVYGIQFFEDQESEEPILEGEGTLEQKEERKQDGNW